MVTTSEIRPGRRIDLAHEVVGLEASDRQARLVAQTGRGPQRIDDFTVGAPVPTGDAPHDGEMHSDGDELLSLVSGATTVTLELADGHRLVDLGRGDGVVVPRSGWHRITMREPGKPVPITPGPNGDARPLAGTAR